MNKHANRHDLMILDFSCFQMPEASPVGPILPGKIIINTEQYM